MGRRLCKTCKKITRREKQVKKQIGGAVKPGVWKSKIWRKIEGHDLDCSQRIIHTRLCLALVQHIAGEHPLLEPEFMIHSRLLHIDYSLSCYALATSITLELAEACNHSRVGLQQGK